MDCQDRSRQRLLSLRLLDFRSHSIADTTKNGIIQEEDAGCWLAVIAVNGFLDFKAPHNGPPLSRLIALCQHLSTTAMDLSTRAQNLISKLASANGHVGYMSCAVYDTAWVAMVTKPTPDGTQWLFPQSFHYILDTQQPDGAWPTYAADVDGILNTAASLLALQKHADTPLQLSTPSSDMLEERIVRGTTALRRLLNAWDVDATNHVGFEFLVPTLLHLLASGGIHFTFPGRAALMLQNHAKLSKMKLEHLYSKHKTTAIHSLEAFLSNLDYNKVRHHKDFGALMASPSSTAAYLMSSSPWDDESEAYLRDVVRLGAGQGSGGVPSAFPSTYFEVTWVCEMAILTSSMTASLLIQWLGSYDFAQEWLQRCRARTWPVRATSRTFKQGSA